MLLDRGLFRERPRQHEFGFEHGVEGVEIDRQSPEALAILGRSARFDRKGRPGAPAAAGAGVEKALMLDDLEQPLRQIEHLTPLNACRHRRTRGAAAMQASRGRMRHDPVGLGDLAKGFALVPLLPAARAARRLAKAHRLLLQAIARRRLRTRPTVQPKPAPKLGILSPQCLQLPLKRRNQSRDLRRKNHPAKQKNHDFLAEAPH